MGHETERWVTPKTDGILTTLYKGYIRNIGVETTDTMVSDFWISSSHKQLTQIKSGTQWTQNSTRKTTYFNTFKLYLYALKIFCFNHLHVFLIFREWSRKFYKFARFMILFISLPYIFIAIHIHTQLIQFHFNNSITEWIETQKLCPLKQPTSTDSKYVWYTNALHTRYFHSMFGMKLLTIVFLLTDLACEKQHSNQGSFEQKIAR